MCTGKTQWRVGGALELVFRLTNGFQTCGRSWDENCSLWLDVRLSIAFGCALANTRSEIFMLGGEGGSGRMALDVFETSQTFRDLFNFWEEGWQGPLWNFSDFSNFGRRHGQGLPEISQTFQTLEGGMARASLKFLRLFKLWEEAWPRPPWNFSDFSNFGRRHGQGLSEISQTFQTLGGGMAKASLKFLRLFKLWKEAWPGPPWNFSDFCLEQVPCLIKSSHVLKALRKCQAAVVGLGDWWDRSVLLLEPQSLPGIWFSLVVLMSAQPPCPCPSCSFCCAAGPLICMFSKTFLSSRSSSQCAEV